MFLFFSYHNDARSNKYRIVTHSPDIRFLTKGKEPLPSEPNTRTMVTTMTQNNTILDEVQ